MEMTMIMKLQRLSSPTILIRETQKHNDDNEEEEEEGDVEEYQVEDGPADRRLAWAYGGDEDDEDIAPFEFIIHLNKRNPHRRPVCSRINLIKKFEMLSDDIPKILYFYVLFQMILKKELIYL